MRKIDLIIVHCTATPEGKDFRAKDVDLWHRQRGFNKIGYHYLVDLNGTVEKGRDEAEIGAHCKGHNSDSIGVCYVGGLDKYGEPKDTRTEAQKKSLRSLLTKLKMKYPSAVIHGHRDFAAKACPCFDATGEYKNLLAEHGAKLNAN